jgi:hypothetical protein
MSLPGNLPGLAFGSRTIEKAGYTSAASLFRNVKIITLFGLADLEHLGSAGWASSRSGWLFILHSHGFRALHLFFSPAFHAITFHI